MSNKKYKTFKINLSENDCKCYLIERTPHKNTIVQRLEYEELIDLLKIEKYQFDNDKSDNNKSNDVIFFINFFGSLFSVYFFISVFLYNLIK